MNSLDMIILVIVIVFALAGYFRGLINTLFNMLSFVISMAVTYFVFPYVSRFIIIKTSFADKLAEKISSAFKFDSMITESMSKSDQLNMIQSLGLPKGTKEMLINNNNSDVFKLMDVTSFKEYISKSLASFAINIIVFVALFFVISILLTILVKLLNLLTEVTHLDQANKLGGAVLGTLMGLLFVFVGLAVLAFVVSTKNQGNLYTLIDQSIIGKYLSDNNPVVDFLSNNIENNHFWKILSSLKTNSK